MASMLTIVGLHAHVMHRFPYACSSGQLHLVIVRALFLYPALIVADEPVSASDVFFQAPTLNLRQDRQEHFGLSSLFIACDLRVVKHCRNAVAAMYVGRIMAMGPPHPILDTPRYPYTSALRAAVSHPNPVLERKRILLQGAVPNPANPSINCTFYPRCPHAEDHGRHEIPVLQAMGYGHWAACHFANSLSRSRIG